MYRRIRFKGGDRQIRFRGGTVKFVTEDGPSNLLQRTDSQIRYIGYRQICFKEGTVEFVTMEGHNM